MATSQAQFTGMDERNTPIFEQFTLSKEEWRSVMEYCNLGNSGLEVARLGLGTIPFGTILDDNACQRFVDTYEDAGGNLVDTSNLYGGGTVGTNTEMAGTAEKSGR